MQPVLKAMMQAENERKLEDETRMQACAKAREASQRRISALQAELNAKLSESEPTTGAADSGI